MWNTSKWLFIVVILAGMMTGCGGSKDPNTPYVVAAISFNAYAINPSLAVPDDLYANNPGILGLGPHALAVKVYDIDKGVTPAVPVWTVISSTASVMPVINSPTFYSINYISTSEVTFAEYGTYTFKVAVGALEDTVTISVYDAAAIKANAGPDLTVQTNAFVLLPDTGIPSNLIGFDWTHVAWSSSSVNIMYGQLSQQAGFFAPNIAGDYIVALRINDRYHGWASSDTVTIHVVGTGSNTPPIASAGTAQAGSIGTQVTLSGSGTDADSNPLTYRWTITRPPASINTSTLTLSGADTPAPYFTPVESGTYTATLIVNDGKVDSAPSNVTISVNAPVVPSNIAPVADAGPAQNATIGSVVTLSGGMSSDANGNALTYSWSFNSVPSIGSVGGSVSSATLTGANTISPTFTPDMAGDYVVSLIVNDGMVNSTADTVIITAAVPAGGVTPVYVTNLKNLLTDNSFLVTHTTASSGLLEVMEFGPYGPGGSMTFTYINPSFSSQSPHVRRTGSWMVLDGSGFAQASESLLFASRVLNTGAPVSSANTLNMTGYSTYSGITDTTVASWIKVAPLTANDLTTNDLAGRTFTSFSAYYTFTADGKGTYYNGWSASAPFTWVIDSTGRKAVITFSAASTHHLFMTVRGSSGTFDREFGILDLYNGDVAGSSLKNWSF